MKISRREFKRMLSYFDGYAFQYNGARFYAVNKRDPKDRAYFLVLGEPGLKSCLFRDSLDPMPETVPIDERIEDPNVKATFNEDDFHWALYQYLKREKLLA
jgi:hypothetical protein